MVWAIFSDEHRASIKEIVESRSDRIVAIVGGAILDNTLHRTLSERLRNDKDINRKLLRVNGALGNTVPKIDLLYMLNAFEKPVRNALYGISEIRNFLAHKLDTSFDSQEKDMVDALNKLTIHEGKKYYPHHLFDQDSEIEIEPVENSRDRFLVNLQLGLIALMRDRVSHGTWSNTLLSENEIRERVRLQNQEKQKP